MSAPADPSSVRDGLLESDRHVLSWYAQARALFTGSNQVRLLRGGDQLFPAMHEAIARARHRVWLLTYIFHDDVAGRAMVAALARAVRRGVRVSVVVDGFGSGQTLERIGRDLTEAGVRFSVFRPLQGWRSWLQPGQWRRLHHKLCVVDADVGFVGGINIIDDRLDIHHGWSDSPRLDFAVEVRGPVVAMMEQTARALWTRSRLGRDWRDELVELARSSHPVARARRMLRRLRATRWQVVEQALNDPCPVRVAFVVRDNLWQRRTIERAYIEAIRSARWRVDLVCPYFYPGRAFRRALRQAAQRGVQVRLLLQGKVDYRMAAWAAQALYDELLSHRIRIFEYTPAFLHAKVAVVDEDWATVGSSNIDPLSLLVNLEGNVIVQDAHFVQELARDIDQAVAASREVTVQTLGLPAWRRYLRRGFVAWVARLFMRVAGATGRY
ncbi:cardiolipin synthase ClsB [Caldimonas manganoxidans]|uniref:cardiolipin synthase ClsB n=1 Tax=Caldimonas manganoxidans TaxID=196015 RepID=UPI0003678861|nr:cardiolipin synthase ClsB [Caldimonas manganoxidans]